MARSERKHTNLLAGRARKAELFRLVSTEIPQFNLGHYLHVGGLPMVYLSDEPYEELAAYVNTYMKDEIQAESLVRNILGFIHFLKIASLTNGKMLNFTSIASDCGLPVSTVREYYYILEDTFLGFMLPAFTATQKRKAISTAKFYLFDLGVANYLAGIKQIPAQTETYGNALEHFIGLEIRAYLSYKRIDKTLSYWRSTSQMEVDFVIGHDVAIEVKTAQRAQDKHLKGLLAFKEEALAKRYILISLDPIAKKYNDGIEALPVDLFLQKLWAGDIIN
ncbi:ATP-binding protein [Caedibacter taeniospiralis]|jgi:predicted AAA+ superfamily ATPase|uniref:ATP-binding protein n=1 Tax=Caedibacter taeniospiralis TaxID=28907 RepID=UPI0037BE31B2